MSNNVIKVSNDLGYGAVKAKLNDEKVQFPSVMAVERAQDIAAPLRLIISNKVIPILKILLIIWM